MWLIHDVSKQSARTRAFLKEGTFVGRASTFGGRWPEFVAWLYGANDTNPKVWMSQ